jgi:hypothetical protein
MIQEILMSLLGFEGGLIVEVDGKFQVISDCECITEAEKVRMEY